MPKAASHLFAQLLIELRNGPWQQHSELIDRIVAELRANTTGRFSSWSRQMLTDLLTAIRKPKE